MEGGELLIKGHVLLEWGPPIASFRIYWGGRVGVRCVNSKWLLRARLTPRQVRAVQNWISIWCPPGPERALSLHVVFFGNNLKMVAAPVAFSWLCAARGWRAACLGMSGMGVLMGAIWQTCAANGPSDWRWGMTAAKSTLLASAEAMMMVSGAGTFIDTPAPCCPHGASTVELWYKCNALSF